MNIKNFNLIHIVLIFLITICVAYIFGLILINLVDNRLSNIKLNIPKQEVIIKYPEEKNNKDLFTQSGFIYEPGSGLYQPKGSVSDNPNNLMLVTEFKKWMMHNIHFFI